MYDIAKMNHDEAADSSNGVGHGESTEMLS